MSPFQPRIMLVTGGAGFIGSHFIRHVLTNEPDVRIINFDKLTYAGSLNRLSALPHPERYHFIQGDITDEKLIRHVLQHHHVDTIVHFAAESHVDRSITSPRAFVDTNVLGTFILLEAARHYWFNTSTIAPAHCRFHHISTDEVYGSLQPGDAPFTEQSPYQPRSPYSASKAGSDHWAAAYYHTYQLPVTITNCSNNYGPHQHEEKFIPTVIRSCLEGKRIPIYGAGKNIRDWLYVEDHCRAVMAVIKQGSVGETYNIGGDNEWENISLAHYICKQMNVLKPARMPYEQLMEHVTDRPGHDFRYAIDSRKIHTALHWSPQETMASGMQKTIQFYLSGTAA